MVATALVDSILPTMHAYGSSDSQMSVVWVTCPSDSETRRENSRDAENFGLVSKVKQVGTQYHLLRTIMLSGNFFPVTRFLWNIHAWPAKIAAKSSKKITLTGTSGMTAGIPPSS